MTKRGAFIFEPVLDPDIRRKIKGLVELEVGEACIFGPRPDDGGEEFGVVVGWDLAEAEEHDLVLADATLEEQKSRLRYHVITETSGIEASPVVLRRLEPSDERQWRAACTIFDESGVLGEWFSSKAAREYPTYVKTKAWAAIYPDE
ncbi:hypothetical protein RQP46_009952 [Phenoliferia psychrophenolica]